MVAFTACGLVSTIEHSASQYLLASIGSGSAPMASTTSSLGQDVDRAQRRGLRRDRRLVVAHGCIVTHAPRAVNRLAGVSFGLTLYQASAILPFSSMRNAERSMPMYERPYIDFSFHTP